MAEAGKAGKAEEVYTPKSAMDELLETFDNAIEDATIPKNIKRVISEVKEDITDDGEADMNIRKSHALSRLEGVTDDPNIPIHGRTVIWDILGKIESL